MDKLSLAKSLDEIASLLESGESLNKPTIAVTNFLSELGSDNVNNAVENLKNEANIIIVGEKYTDEFEYYEATDDASNADVIEGLFKEGKIDAAVTMHYPFPIGVSTVGRVVAPANGKLVYIANTTGTNDTNREKAMVMNAIDGIIAAKANGIKNPTIGILNVDSARVVEKKLKELKENGFNLTFAESKRGDGGVALRGNDVLAASSDIVVTDSLTGNVIQKVFSSFTSGGFYETTGSGYGPSIGEGFYTPVFIVSRASGTPVIEQAIRYAIDCVKGNINQVSKDTYAAAKKAGLEEVLKSLEPKAAAASDEEEVKVPDKEIVNASIGGIDILEIEDAIKAVHKAGIYAESAMGCTGPVVMVSEAHLEEVKNILRENNYIE